ncbi:MAG: DUF5060 domain-containing protein [Planctomycetota bacterium]
MAGQTSQQPALLSDLVLDHDVVPQYGKLELTCSVHTEASNPFDPEELSVTARVRTPGGKEVLAPGFFYQGFTRRKKDDGEELTPQGEGVWKVRYAPLERGRHKLRVRVAWGGQSCESEELSFQCVESSSHGYVRQARNGRAFEADDQTPYFPIGMNLCWGRSTYDYDLWMDKLAAHGCNWARLWIGPFDLFTLETPRGLGSYDQANAWRVDYVTELAERKGIRLMFCLESFNDLRVSPGSPFWEKCPWNAVNGGPCYIPEEFFTNPLARRLFRQRLRYIAARWGYSTHVFAWELWNEVDIVEEYVGAEVAPWHAEMARCLAACDPNRHLISTSFANSEGDPEIDGLREMSFVQTHNYGSADIAGALNRYSLDKAGRYAKPHFVGEFGLDAGAKGNAEDPAGEHLHEGLWAGSLSLAAGTPMLWWWDNYIQPHDLYHHYLPLAKFLSGVEWNKRKFRAAEPGFTYTQPQPPRLLDLALAGQQNVWEEHPSNKPQTITVHNGGTVVGAENLSAYLHGLRNHPTFHNPVTFCTEGEQGWQLAVAVSSVSQYGGAILDVYVDDELALEANFKEDPLKKNDALKCYNGEYLVSVPPGKHEVRVDNAGTDWMICQYKLLGYVQKVTPDLRAFGVQDDTLALLWLQNETTSHAALAMQVPPRTAAHVALHVGGLKNGRYTVELWDTERGECQTLEARVEEGRLMLPLPPVDKDIAVKLQRK